MYSPQNTTVWDEVGVLVSPGNVLSNFGCSIAQDGEWLAVGANGHGRWPVNQFSSSI
jgi:hypothetical protein